MQEIIKNSQKAGHENFLLAALLATEEFVSDATDSNHCNFFRFESEELPFPIAGMSDVMPYSNTRFCDLTPEQMLNYNLNRAIQTL